MRFKKLLLSIMLMTLISVMLSLSVMAAEVDNVGVKMQMVNAENGIMTMKVQMKLPENSGGVTSFANIISFDNSKLTLVGYNSTSTEYTTETNTATSTYTSPIINVSIKDADNAVYGVFDATVDTVGTTTTLKTTLMTQITGSEVADPHTTQNTTAWQDVYYFKFKIAGTGNPKTELNQDSIRFFDATTDSANLAAADLNWATFFDAASDGTQYTNNYTGSGSAPADASTMGEVVLYFTNADVNGVTVNGAISSYNPKNDITVKLMQGDSEIKSITVLANPTASPGVINSTFEIPDVEPGTYDLVVEKLGHRDYVINNVVVDIEPLDLTAHSDANINTMILAAGDVNRDGSVNALDIAPFSSQFLNNAIPVENRTADITGDGNVSALDLSPFSSNFLRSTTYTFN